MRRALLIGNSIYIDPQFSPLEKARADVQAMANVLGDPTIGGFEVDPQIDKSVEVVRMAIADFFHRAKKDDFLLFYFSGHGHAWNNASLLHLIARDTHREGVFTEGISATFIKDQMRMSKAETQVLLLDCCCSGRFVEGIKGSPRLGKTNVSVSEEGRGVVILAASSDTEPAWEGDNTEPLSLFTYYLHEALETGAADRERRGVITIEAWYDYASKKVMEKTKQEQIPNKFTLKQQGSIVIAQTRGMSLPTSLPQRLPSRRPLLVTLSLLLTILLASGIGLFFVPPLVHQSQVVSQMNAMSVTASKIRATVRAQACATVTAHHATMFGFDAAHTRYNPCEQRLGPSNVSQLKLLWNFPLDGYIDVPTIADGLVYVVSTELPSSPDFSKSGKLAVFDAACRKACQPLWSYSTEHIFHSSPAVAGGLVYVSGDALYAFDATCRSACQPLWSFDTKYDIDGSPAVAGGLVYVVSHYGELSAFDATCRSACQPVWSFDTKDFTVSSPAITDSLVYVYSHYGKLSAFDATCRKACKPLWTFLTGIGTTVQFADYRLYDSSPVVAGDLLFVGTHYPTKVTSTKVYIFDAACQSACKPLWNFPGESYVGPSLTVANNLVYIGTEDHKLNTFGLES